MRGAIGSHNGILTVLSLEERLRERALCTYFTLPT